jgi:hypothetical protein
MPGHDDTVMDGLALIEAVHAGDLGGGRAVLANADTVLLSAFLARVCVDVIEGLLLADDPDLFAWLRRHYIDVPF